jgi:hemerythrin-like domain-containing protein
MKNNISNPDFLKRNVEKDTNGQAEYSPMDPPDAYNPLTVETVPYKDLHPALQLFMDEHKNAVTKLEEFEKTLIEIKDEGMNKERNKRLAVFFNFYDNNIVLHNIKEERVLFPYIHDRMIDNGEHGTGPIPQTAATMLEDDHDRTIEMATLAFGLIRISSQITDPASRSFLMNTAIEQGLSLIELLRLHIFREDKIVFPLAHKYLTATDFEEITKKMKKYFSVELPGKQSFV